MNEVQIGYVIGSIFFTMLGAVVGKLKNRIFLGAILANVIGVFGILAICLFNKRPIEKKYTSDEIACMVAVSGILLFLQFLLIANM